MSDVPATPAGPDASAMRLASILAAAPDPIFTFDSEQRLLEFNPAAERVFGRSAVSVIGRPLPEMVLSPELPGAELMRVIMGGAGRDRGQRVETVARRSDGSEFPCEITVARIEEHGRSLFTALLRDVTDRRNTERKIRELNEGLERQVAARTAELEAAVAALQHARTRLEAAQEIAHVGDVEINLKTGTRVWSAEVFRLYGFDVVDQAPPWDVVLTRIHPDDQARCNGMLAQALQGRVPEPVDYRVIRRDGSSRWIRATGRFTAGVLALTLADVTDRKNAEQQLLTMVEREREFGRMKADFVYTVTHEYRTPLSVVLSSAEILERYHDRLDAADRALHVREIRTHARRLAELVDEVLFLGRMESGAIELHLTPMDLRTVCREIVDSVVTALGAERTVHLGFERTPPRLMLDERLVRHILSNLVHNALKYSTLDQPVWLDVANESSELVVRVRDRGIGIPPTDQTRMFQSFQRASNVGAISGSGLGLVVVKRCVEMHGGSIALKSVLGEGTEFTVRLPWTLPETPPAKKVVAKPAKPAKSLAGRKRPAKRRR